MRLLTPSECKELAKQISDALVRGFDEHHEGELQDLGRQKECEENQRRDRMAETGGDEYVE